VTQTERAPTDAAPRRRRRLVVALQAAIAVALLVALWRIADGAEALRLLTTAAPLPLLVCALALTAHTVLAALRWRAVAAPLGIALRRREAIAEYYLSQLVNGVVPGGVVGDAGRAVRSRHPAGLGAAGLAVVVERFAGQYALLVVMGIAVTATVAVPGGVDWPSGIVPLLAVIVAAALALPALVALAALLPGRVGAGARRVGGGIRTALSGPRTAAAVVATSLGTTACILTAFASAVAAVGEPVGWSGALAVVPVVLLAMVLPISFGGWGVREGAAVALLPLAGVAASQALAASIVFGLVALAVSLPGIVVLARHRAPRIQPHMRASK
jgi:uncharacterized membrane protein YbhN (UPF0104 family)